MVAYVQRWMMIAPLMALGSEVSADSAPLVVSATDPFSFDPTELDPIRFTRADVDALSSSNLIHRLSIDHPADIQSLLRQTEFSFKLKPKLPDFSREGAFGFDLFDAKSIDVQSSLVGVDGLNPTSTLHEGLEYSAGVTFEYEDEQIDGTAYVSSSLLGLSYGRLGQLWYGAIDVNLEQFSPDRLGNDASDILSLDVTTGRRFGITGLDANSPLWMLSLQGNLTVDEWEENHEIESSSDWFVNPTLFWQQPGFKFSAQMQVPIQFETLDEQGDPDYRLRAVFEKQFK